ncbi:MAG TPA: glycosyltransferase, partial [Candidatus Saccharimonadales bacterium]|nr:glycosyltransferase [Candidatus Saccharimonadales bacterium]
MSTTPKVSVIVTTRNNHETLGNCLHSIRLQSYEPIEMVVVDNGSTDDTKHIARRYTDLVWDKGPERSTQRNFAVEKSTGEYVVIIDSDMELAPHVIESCVAKMQEQPDLGGLIIPEESFGEGFWAQCKRLERSFYVGIDWVEAARFFRRDLYEQVGGYDVAMVSGEDWDLSRRIGKLAPIGRVDAFIRHNEGRLSLIKTLGKKYYYAGLAKGFLQKNDVGSNLTAKEGPLNRYKLFFSKPGKLFRNPLLGAGVLFMKTC